MRRRCLKALLSHLVNERRKCHWLERPISTVDFWWFVNFLNKDFSLQTFAPSTLRLASKLLRVWARTRLQKTWGKKNLRRAAATRSG